MSKTSTYIKEEKIKELILRIYDYRDEISKILDKISVIVNSTSKYYISSDGEKFRQTYNSFSYNYNTLLDNIKSYGEDLSKVIKKYQEMDIKSIDILKK